MTSTTTASTTTTDSPTNNVQHHPITSAAELAPGNSNRYGLAHAHAVSDCCTLYPLSRSTRLTYVHRQVSVFITSGNWKRNPAWDKYNRIDIIT